MAAVSSSSSLNNNTILLCNSEREFLCDGCRDDCRMDGRKRNEFRTYSILTGSAASVHNGNNQQQQSPLILSNGSARLMNASVCNHNNAIHIVCSVKADVVAPTMNHPQEGIVEINVDGISSSSNKRRTSRMYDEITSLLNLLLLEHIVDKKQLCIVPNQHVWKLNIDIYLLSSNMTTTNNIIDPISHIIRAALYDTLLPSISVVSKEETKSDNHTISGELIRYGSTQSNQNQTVELVVDGDIQSADRPPGIDAGPIIITVTIMKCSNVSQSSSQYVLLFDATLEEVLCSYAQLHVSIILPTTKATATPLKQPIICGIIKSGYGSLPSTLLPKCISSVMEIVTSGAVDRSYCAATTSSHSTNNMFLLQEQFAIQ